jgi:Cu+-exporting ATPase
MKDAVTERTDFRIINPKGKTDTGRLSERLKAVPGVSDVSVDGGSGIVSLQVDDSRRRHEAIAAILAEVDRAGLSIPQTWAEVDILNMRCAGCVTTLKHGLKRIPGIVDVRVNFATQTGRVEWMEGIYNRARLLEDIKDIGYEAVFHVDDRAQERDDRRLRRDLALAVACTSIIFILHMGEHLFHLFAVDPVVSALVQLALTLPVLYAGRTFFVDAAERLRHLQSDMNSLIALGSGSAFVYSLAITLRIVFGGGQVPAVYYETTAMILTFILIGKYLEARATREARDAVTGMAQLIPQAVTRLSDDGTEEEIAVGELIPGDKVIVRPGQSIPADGIIIDGESAVDESLFTGEAMPVAKRSPDTVIGGTVNIGGGITVSITRTGSGTVLAGMIRMVREAQTNKAPIQRLADRVAGIFVPIVILTAVVTMFLWMIFSPGSKMVLLAPVAVLLVACPCALGLATPTAILVGTGRAARLGVLFRNGEILERLSKADCFVFDKTGTLTDGRPRVEKIIVAEGYASDDVLRLAASAEQYSEHPYGYAIRERATVEGIKFSSATRHELTPGQGVLADIDGHKIAVGRKTFVLNHGVADEQKAELAVIEQQEGAPVVYVTRDGSYLGAIVLADTIKDGAGNVVQTLLKQGREVIMLTGDNRFVAATIAARLGIKRVEAEATPEKKLATVDSLRRAEFTTAMIGDGVNDAAALAAADIGISLGTGTDIAMRASDITITGRSLDGVLTALNVSAATLKIIKQNLFWAFFYNIVMIPFAAGILYPFFGVTLSPALAAAAMALSSVFVVSNSLRLRNLQPFVTIAP